MSTDYSVHLAVGYVFTGPELNSILNANNEPDFELSVALEHLMETLTDAMWMDGGDTQNGENVRYFIMPHFTIDESGTELNFHLDVGGGMTYAQVLALGPKLEVLKTELQAQGLKPQDAQITLAWMIS